MKILFNILLVGILSAFLSRCKNLTVQQSPMENADSVKKIIIDIIAQMAACRGDKVNGPAKFETFCEDSIIVVDYDNTYMTSAKQISQDLASGTRTAPRDFNFHLYGNTAIICYIESFTEHYYNDTIYHEVRALRTFVNNNGKWKLASGTNTLVPINYYKPVVDRNAGSYHEYAGVYQFVPSYADTFFVKDKKLYYAGTGDKPQLLFPVNEYEYMIKTDLLRVVFGRDANGKVAYYYMVRPDGQRIKVPKVK